MIYDNSVLFTCLMKESGRFLNAAPRNGAQTVLVMEDPLCQSNYKTQVI
jgi:hypothetical protein